MKELQNELITPVIEDATYDILELVKDNLVTHNINYHLANKYPNDVISYLIELGIPTKLHYIIMSINKIDSNTDLTKYESIKLLDDNAINMLMTI